VSDFNWAILDDVGGRPWPLPQGPWLLAQTWTDLLFAHWRMEPAALRRFVPDQFVLDTFDGAAWIGVVPFRMSNVAPRGVPAFDRVSTFPELNVRTYVTVNHRPGVYFFSLDAGSRLAVRAARQLLNLPYFRAAMVIADADGEISYTCRRWDGRAEFRATYGPDGSAFVAEPGSLEYFLTERYCLYNLSRSGQPYRLEIHHPRWKLQIARAELSRNTMAQASGVTLPSDPPLLHFAKRQDTLAWAPAFPG
jgi:uncharacterized protein